MLRVTIEGRDYEALTDLVRRHEVDVVRTTARQSETGAYRVDAVVDPDRVPGLAAAGYGIKVIEDVEAVIAERRADIDWHPDDLPGAEPHLPRLPHLPTGPRFPRGRIG